MKTTKRLGRKQPAAHPATDAERAARVSALAIRVNRSQAVASPGRPVNRPAPAVAQARLAAIARRIGVAKPKI